MPRPSQPSTGAESEDAPLHLLVDSTGLKLCEPGEWLIENHGTKTRQSWTKLPLGLALGLDARNGQIVASALTSNGMDDGAQAGSLLEQITGPVAVFIADGAYDQEGVHASVAQRHPEASVVVPPRATAVLSNTAKTAPTQRDCHLQHIAEHGRMA